MGIEGRTYPASTVEERNTGYNLFGCGVTTNRNGACCHCIPCGTSLGCS